MSCRSLLAALSVLAPATVPAVAANEFVGTYVGIDVFSEKQKFKPRYDFATGAPSQSYSDSASGQGAALRIGHGWALDERLTLAAQLRFAHANNEWTLRTTEPAVLDYRIPTTLQLGLVARYVLSGPWSVQAEAAIGRGDVHLHKRSTSATVSQYERTGAANQQAWALGVAYALTDALDVQAEYRSSRYESISTTSAVAGSSTVVETIHDRPTSQSLGLGLRYRW